MRCRCASLLASILYPISLLDAQTAPHEREFDFWVGEWNVQNRSLGGDGKWSDAGRARARIRPILGGRAILEEWDGRSGGRKNTFGISVRCYDPGKKRWVIVLNWPGARSASFGQMEGSFRHGRAEFFPPAAFQQKVQRAERFTFSDGLPDTCRWDMANPTSGGGWRTSWIMEFTREKSAVQVKAEGEPVSQPAKPVCATAEARQFDKLIGVWKGTGFKTGTASKRESVRATYRATSTNRGCGTLCFLDVTDSQKRVAQSFEAWAYSPQAKKWVARAIDDSVPRFFVVVGVFASATNGSFVRTDRAGRPLERTRRVRYYNIAEDRFRCAHDVSKDHGQTWKTVLELRFKR